MSRPLSYFMERIKKVPILDAIENNLEPWHSAINLDSDCWIWISTYDGRGRPSYSDANRKTSSASRAIWRLTKNPDLSNPKIHLCHNCPNIKCVNPEHLYEGDATTNRNDEVARHRCSLRKLKGKTDEIVKLFKEGIEQQEIAKKIGVCRATITRFLNGQVNKESYNYVKEAEENRNNLIKKLFEEGKTVSQIIVEANVPQTVVYSVVPEIRKRKTEEDKNKIREGKKSGTSARVLAKQYNLSVTQVYGICKEK